MSEDTNVSTSTFDEVAAEIRERLDANASALADATSEENLKRLVSEAVAGLDANDEAFERKTRFSADSADGKPAKYRGMSDADLEWLAGYQAAQHKSPHVDLRANPELAEIASEAKDRLVDEMTDSEDESKLAEARTYARDLQKAKARAMDTAESGYGSQLIGNQYVGSLWAAARASARIAPLIRTFQMTAPTAYLPVEVDFPEMLYVTENTANNSSNYTTTKTGSQRVQVDAKKFIIHQMWSGEMEEDSIIPFVPFLRRQAQLSVAHYQDSLVLNGDTTNTATGNINLDDADPADTKHYLAWDGLRHVALVDNTGNGTDASGAITYEDFYTNLRDNMWDSTRFHDWGNPNNPSDLVYIADRSTASKASLLDEVITVDKYGGQATVLNGEVAMIGRSPLIVSSAMSLTEADGKVSTTAGNNTLGQVTAFNRNGFVLGLLRTLRAEVERLPATDQTRIVYSARWGFGRFTPTGAAAGIEATATLYNITV